jgi:hypothetical protein
VNNKEPPELGAHFHRFRSCRNPPPAAATEFDVSAFRLQGHKVLVSFFGWACNFCRKVEVVPIESSDAEYSKLYCRVETVLIDSFDLLPVSYRSLSDLRPISYRSPTDLRPIS